MGRQLALELRPKKLSELIGQEELISSIRNRYSRKEEPSAVMFVGTTGTGKTTLARILALSLQCRHGDFGEPCDDCRAAYSGFEIGEINASEETTKEGITEVVRGSSNRPFPPSRRKVIILDEAQKLSKGAQNLLLKYFEEAVPTTVWIVCTTEPEALGDAFKRRCRIWRLRELATSKVITKVVNRGLAHLNADVEKFPAGLLVEALMEQKVRSPALILNAVGNYLDGDSPKKAASDLVEGYDTKAICRSIISGDWGQIRKETVVAEPDQLAGIRASVAGYLRKVLEDQNPGPKATEYATAICMLAEVDSYSKATQGPATVATLYKLSQMMARRDIDND